MSRLEYSYFYQVNTNHMIHLRKSITSIIFLVLTIVVFGQKSAVYEYGDNDYLKGLELFEKEKYGAARHLFDQFLSSTIGSRSEIRSEASFYRAMSAVELRHDDSEYLTHTFISEFPESPHVDEAAFRLADFFYDVGIICGARFLSPRLGIHGLALGVVAGATLHLAPSCRRCC